MSKIVYSATMSLDGFIAGPGGDMSWLIPHLGPNPAADRLVAEIGALLIGRRTFDGDDPNKGTDKEGAFGGAWSGPHFVLTHRAPATPVPGVTFVGDLAEGLAAAKAAAGGGYVNIIGADVARQCVEAGVLDEVVVFVAPVMLGGGVRLFDRPGGAEVRLERVEVTESPRATSMRFRVAG
ncbi:dihydrofolate reductase family protein [Nonomuraea pusilla]|uniref:Dihydrofolate reductase n=1 Tax=Nonomuraea pusilla TaxID=46177 RepID=A0A1H8HKT7_9ACTN|nr:dihydrofolate reductase family protein [Nonomuraea pusilla]SEN56607.1 Dihydrofolate reductase [Nonomuraea pusilla]